MTDTSRLKIEWEWESAPAVKAPELRATFARLRIFVDADCVTLVEDRQTASSRRAILCPLYPLAEWVAYNWWFLQADARLSAMLAALRSRRELPPGGQRHWQRHSLRGAGDGFLWPDLFILPEEPRTRLLWRADRSVPDGRPIRFLTQGEAILDAFEVQHALGGLVEAVIERLADCGIGATRLTEEWRSLKEPDADEASYCRAAARLGLDPYSEAAKYEGEILRAGQQLRPPLLGEFLDTVDPEKMADDLDWVIRARDEIAHSARPSDEGLPKLRTEVARGVGAADLSHPWELGYAGARTLRRIVGLDVTDSFDVDSFVSKSILPAPDRSLHAFGGGPADIAPSVVLGRKQHEDSERFTLARALWHFLQRPGEQFLITPAHTLRQKAERAFAAELLAPAAGVAKLVGENPDDIGVDELEAAERHFHVSSLIIQHQIDNQLTFA